MNPLEFDWRERLNNPPMCMAWEFDINKVDKGVRPLVTLLRNANFQTIGSCEGGKIACSNRPYVSCLPDVGSTPAATILRLDRWLMEHGFSEYELSLHIVRGQKSNPFNGIPLITVHFPQFDPAPLNEGKFSHKQHHIHPTRNLLAGTPITVHFISKGIGT